MKKTDIFLLVLLFSAAIISVVYFVPDKGKLAAEILADTVKIGVRQSQISFVQKYLSLNNLIHYEMGNPLKTPEKVKKVSDDLTVTDEDIQAYMRAARKKAKTVKGKPTCIIANTIKGFGGGEVMEDKASWHHHVPNQEEYQQIMDEIECRKEALA